MIEATGLATLWLTALLSYVVCDDLQQDLNYMDFLSLLFSQPLGMIDCNL